MPDAWPRVEAELRRVLRDATERPRGIAGTTAAGDRVTVDLVPGPRSEWLVLRAPICRADEMDPRPALERNGTLAFTAIALGDGEYFLRASIPLEAPEAADLGALVALLADAARALRPHVEPVADPFGHYV